MEKVDEQFVSGGVRLPACSPVIGHVSQNWTVEQLNKNIECKVALKQTLSWHKKDRVLFKKNAVLKY